MTDELIGKFVDAARRKFIKGVEEHRGGDFSQPFRGNLWTEFQDEMLDAHNYVAELRQGGHIDRDEYLHISKALTEFWSWAENRRPALN